MAIHCDPVSEEIKPFMFSKTRWIAASSCRPPRNDKSVLSSRGLKAPSDPLTYKFRILVYLPMVLNYHLKHRSIFTPLEIFENS